MPMCKLQTSKFSLDGLSAFFGATDKLETMKKHSRCPRGTSVKVSEEWFDVEHTVSLSPSLNNIMRYFDEEVDLTSSRTPIKPPRARVFHSTPVSLPNIREKSEKKSLGPTVKRIAELFNDKIKQSISPLKRKSFQYTRIDEATEQSPRMKSKAQHKKGPAPSRPSMDVKSPMRKKPKRPAPPVPSRVDPTFECDKTFSGLTVKEKISLFDNLTSEKCNKPMKALKNLENKEGIQMEVMPSNVEEVIVGPTSKRILSEVESDKLLSGPSQKVLKTNASEPKVEVSEPETVSEYEPITTEEEFVFLKPIPPPRKKKTKRTLKWKDEEESTASETTTALTPTPVMQRKLQDSDLSESVDAEKLIEKLKEVNDVRKVKTAYTLTAMPTPSPRLSTASRFHFSDSMTEPEWDSPARFSIGNSTPIFMKLPDSVFKQSSNSRRSSLTGTSRRSSMNMDVIFEEIKNIEQNMDTIKSQVRGIGRGSSSESGRTSSFWISYGSFRMALDIQFNASNRLRKCYEIFSEKAAETEAAKLTFGIDNMKFSFDDCASRADVSRQLTKHRKSSHYWFLAGDLIMPFTGPHLTKERIASMFEFIRSSAGNASDLKFGVDHLEFSKADKKCAWTSTPLKTSDLGSDGFESECNGSPLRLSPFERRSSIYDNNRHSISSFSSFEGVDLLNYEYEHDPVEKIFHARMNRLPGFV